MTRKRLKDIDAAARTLRIRAFVLALTWGMPLGVIGGAGGAVIKGWNPLVGAVLGAILGLAVTYYVPMTLAAGAGTAAKQIYAPSGESTPRRPEYSYAQSLVARGQYEDAAVAYELHAIENPNDPEPYFQLARIYKNHLHQYEDAIAWYRRARADVELTRGENILTMQEIAELYVHMLHTPRKAIPELAQLAQQYPDEPAGRAAKQELASMRALLAEEQEGLSGFTTLFLKKLDRGTLMQAATKTREEMEREMIAEALRETGGDRSKAAEKLGVPLNKLEEAMRRSSPAP